MQSFTKLEILTKAIQGHNEKIPETKKLPPVGFDPKQPPAADPGFPRGGGANPPSGAPTYDFAKFFRKLHEIERIWTPKGCTSLSPLRSANDLLVVSLTLHETLLVSMKLLIPLHRHICPMPRSRLSGHLINIHVACNP